MLIPVDDGAAVVVCSTCRRGSPAHAAAEGAQLIEALRTVQASDPTYRDIAVQEMACLFACNEACVVHVRAPGRIGYVMGRFVPDANAARAILDYAAHHAASAEGEVAFGDWPDGVKDHFITRTPPPGFVAT